MQTVNSTKGVMELITVPHTTLIQFARSDVALSTTATHSIIPSNPYMYVKNIFFVVGEAEENKDRRKINLEPKSWTKPVRFGQLVRDSPQHAGSYSINDVNHCMTT